MKPSKTLNFQQFKIENLFLFYENRNGKIIQVRTRLVLRFLVRSKKKKILFIVREVLLSCQNECTNRFFFIVSYIPFWFCMHQQQQQEKKKN